MMEDLLTPEAGFAIAERAVETNEVGGSPRHLADIVLGVVREAGCSGSASPRWTPSSWATGCCTSSRKSADAAPSDLGRD